MNNKIKELYVETTGKEWAYDFDPILAEKFAELIVRECADVCFNKYAHSDRMSKQCGINFANDIKEHFGVEE